MTTFYIVRHARAESDSPTGQDRDRPLAGAGVLQCEGLARRFADGQLTPPATAISSPATRARQTAEKVLAGLDGPGIVDDDRIWEAGVAELVEVIDEARENPGPVLIVGHNPGLEALVRTLTGEVHPMGTAALAVLELDGAPAPGAARLIASY